MIKMTIILLLVTSMTSYASKEFASLARNRKLAKENYITLLGDQFHYYIFFEFVENRPSSIFDIIFKMTKSTYCINCLLFDTFKKLSTKLTLSYHNNNSITNTLLKIMIDYSIISFF